MRRYTRYELVNMSSFPGYKRDLYKLALENGIRYTLAEADALVQEFKEDMF